MKTRFVIHKNLLSPVYRVIKRPAIYTCYRQQISFYPEDITVENPKRVNTGGYFILPKSDYVPCDKNGVVKDSNVDSAPLAHCGQEYESRVEFNRKK